MLPQGTSVILISQKEPGKILAVNRKNPPFYFCFPGGKVEPDEDHQTGAQRELVEETGILVPKNTLMPIYSGVCAAPNEKNYWVTTYFVKINDYILGGEVELNPKFISIEEFISFSAFTTYNIEALGNAKKLGLINFNL